MEISPAHEPGRPALDAALEAAALRALRADWVAINWSHFREAMKPPVLTLVDGETRLGRYLPSLRAIEIARRLIALRPWGVVIEVLKHEMAHQYVYEVLKIDDETAHGPAFRQVCERHGIDASAAGLPSGVGDLGDETRRVLSRIAKLLALAGSPNRNEAESAMSEARRLMAKHNLDEDAAGAKRGYAFRHLGEPQTRLESHHRLLATLLTSHFFVEAIFVRVHRAAVGTPGTLLEICGTEANLEMAAYVHAFLLRTAERLWDEHRRAAGVGNRDRRSFLYGVMRGFDEKLDRERTPRGETALVWVPTRKDRHLHDYYRRRHPRITTVRSGSRGSADAFEHGQRAGQGIVLHKPVTSGAPGGPRLLAGR